MPSVHVPVAFSSVHVVQRGGFPIVCAHPNSLMHEPSSSIAEGLKLLALGVFYFLTGELYRTGAKRLHALLLGGCCDEGIDRANCCCNCGWQAAQMHDCTPVILIDNLGLSPFTFQLLQL